MEQGFAYIAGDKGIPGGAADMLSGTHPTQHWGDHRLGGRGRAAFSTAAWTDPANEVTDYDPDVFSW